MSNIFTPKREMDEGLRFRHLQALVYLCDALASLCNPVETAIVLTDFLSPQEMLMLANRLQVAALLLDGHEYSKIRDTLGVSTGTIARVSTWLEVGGDGYRLLTSRTHLRSIKAGDAPSDTHRLTKSSQYLWPQELVSYLLKTMSKDNAYRILDILAEAQQKPELFRILNRDDYE